MRSFGYFLVWADSYRVFFGIHALLIGPVDFETHLHTYLSVFAPMVAWFIANSPLHRELFELSLLSAAPVYFVSFFLTTSLGMWLVQKVLPDGAGSSGVALGDSSVAHRCDDMVNERADVGRVSTLWPDETCGSAQLL